MSDEFYVGGLKKLAEKEEAEFPEKVSEKVLRRIGVTAERIAEIERLDKERREKTKEIPDWIAEKRFFLEDEYGEY